MTKPRDLATLGGGFTQSETGAIQRTVENKLKDTVSVKDFGAVGNGIADDTAAFTAALATGKTVEAVSNETYKIISTLTVNLFTQSFNGNGATLDFSTLSGSAVALTTQLTPPSNGLQNDLNYPGVISNAIRGWKILGPAKAANPRGTTVGFQPAQGHVSLSNVLIWGFGYGINYGTNVYCTEFNSVNVGQCSIGLRVPSGGSNYGERLSFVNSTIYDNTLGIYNYCNTGAIHFTNCSIDYNGKTLESGNSAITELHNSWWECLDAGTTGADGGVHATISDNSRLVMIGGHIQLNGTPSALTQNAFINSTGGAADFFNVFMFNLKNTGNVFDNGSGFVRIEGTTSYGVSYLPSRISVNLNNKLTDPGFESTSIEDFWFLLEDTVAITNRITGTNISLSTVTTTPRNGARCLRANKASSGLGNFGLLVPAKPGQRVAMSGWGKVSAGSPSIFIDSKAALVLGLNSNGLPIITKQQLFDTVSFGGAGSTANWTEVSTGMDRILPAWATHYLLTFNTTTQTGALLFDDFTVTTM
jgi:hypothetical protein